MNRFALALILLAVAGRIACAEETAAVAPAAPQPALPVVAVPQAAPLFRAPTDNLPTFVGAFDAPAPKAAGAPVPHPVQQVAAQSDVSPKVALLRQKQEEIARLQQEVQQLQRETHTSQQILLNVQMLRFSLTEMRKLGVDLSPDSGGYFNGSTVSRMLTTVTPEGPHLFMPPKKKANSSEVSRVLDWMAENNIGEIMCEPNVVALEGRHAQFQVGGEIPMPAKDNSKVIEYQPFGTQIDFVATCVGDDQVRVQLKVRFSEVDAGNVIEVNGVKCPRLNVQQLEIGIASRFGEPTVLTGMTEKTTNTVKIASGLEEVANRVRGKPNTRDFTNETCLMLVVTPERVDAIGGGQ